MSLTPTVSNATNTGVIWTVAGVPGGNSTVGTISASGIFTAPQSLPVPATEVVQAASAADAAKTASATITILSDITITLAPSSAAVELGSAQDFQPNLISGGRPIAAMNWSIQGAGCSGIACGTITSGGLFTAPQILPNPPTVLLTATSVADPSKHASVPVTIVSHFTIGITGPSPVAAGGSGNYVTTLTPATNSNPSLTITWSVSGSGCAGIACGTIASLGSDGSAVYHAPTVAPAPDQVTITATPAADPSKAASLVITVSSATTVSVTVSPNPVSLGPGATQAFTAAVSGIANQQVTWSIAGAACGGFGSPCGTIDGTGLFRAPTVAPSPDAISVIATSAQDTSSSGAAEVTISTGPAISFLAPSSATAGAAGGFTLDVQGANFATSSPGPGSIILIGGTARATICGSAADCTTTLAAGDLALAGNLSVAIENPGGVVSIATNFVVAPQPGGAGSIVLTASSPVATGKDIVVVDLSTNGSSIPAQDVSLSLIEIGNFHTSTNTCSLGAGALEVTPPVSGIAAVSICALSISGLNPSEGFAISGPTPADVLVAGAAPLGLGIVELQIAMPSAAQTGARVCSCKTRIWI